MENFNKLKKSVNRDALIKSLAYAFAVGIFCIGLSLLIGKLSANTLKIIYVILIGLAGAGLAFVGLFFLLKRSEKVIARKVDERYNLNEKIQTMVAFQNAEGDMIRLQRDDAESKLYDLPSRGNIFKRFWASALAVALGVGMFITGITVSDRTTISVSVTPPPSQEKTFALSSLQINKVNALIAYVESEESNIQSPAKEQVAAEIKNLLRDLETVTLERVMKEKVINCIVAADGYIDAMNTYKEICVALDNSENELTRIPALAMINLDQSELVLVTEEKLLKNLATKEDLSAFIIETKDCLTSLIEQREIVSSAELLASAQNESESVTDSLESSLEEIESNDTGDSSAEKPNEEPTESPLLTDALYLALQRFVVELEQIVTSEADYSETEFKAEIEKVIVAACGKTESDGALIQSGYIGEALQQQKDNIGVRDSVLNELTAAFRITKDELPQLACDVIPSVGSLRQEGEGESSTGGSGDGENVFAGKDKIFDPIYADGYVEYGTVLENESYKEKYTALWEGEGVSDALKEMLKEYSQKLLDATQKA